MVIPAISDLILPDKAVTAAGHSAVASGKLGKNIEIEEFLEEFLAQLESLDTENTGALPILETGKLLPPDLPGGNDLPPGQVQQFVMQALEHPGAMMSLLASLRQDLHAKPDVQNIGDAIEKLPGLEQRHKPLDRIQDVAGKLLAAVKASGKETVAEPVSLTDIDNPIDNPVETDADVNRLHRIVSIIDNPNLNSQSNTHSNSGHAVREPSVHFNTLSSMSPVQHQPRVDAPTQAMTIQPQLFTPDWSEAFSSNMLVLVKDKVQSAHLNLNPPELGPIEIRMSVKNDLANIQFFSQHGVVRDVIEDAMPRLREMMAGSGINLGDVNVSQHSASDRSYTPVDPGFADFTGDSPVSGTEEAIQAHIVARGLVDHYI